MHAINPNQQVRILTIQIAVADEMSALLSENGICSETSHILDWRYLTEYQPTVTAGDDPEEGEVFGLLDFHLTINTQE